MKTAILTTLSLCVTAVTVEDLPMHTKLMNALYNKEYHAAPWQDKVVSQQVRSQLWDVAPCQYWYNDAWYNLIGNAGFTDT